MTTTPPSRPAPRNSQPKAKALNKAVRARIAYGVDKRSSYAFTLPSTSEAYDAMVEQGARAMYEHSYHQPLPKMIRSITPKAPTWEVVTATDNPFVDGLRAKARSFLSSLGINSPAHEA